MNKKELSKFWTTLSNVVPPVGFVLYFLHRQNCRNKAKKALGSGLIGIPVGIVMWKWVMPFLFGLF